MNAHVQYIQCIYMYMCTVYKFIIRILLFRFQIWIVFCRLWTTHRYLVSCGCKESQIQAFQSVFSPATDDGDWDEVTDTMRRLNAKWRDVGRGLKVDTVTLDCLFQSHHHDPGHCMAELLKDWLDNCDEPSWRILAKVAFRMNKSVAKEIAQKHPGEKT